MELRDEFVSTGEAARALGVSAEMVRVWIRQGRVPTWRTPLGHLIRRDDLERLRVEREQKKKAQT